MVAVLPLPFPARAIPLFLPLVKCLTDSVWIVGNMTSSSPIFGVSLSIVHAQDASTTAVGLPPALQPRDAEQPIDADPGTPNPGSSWDILGSNNDTPDRSKDDLDATERDCRELKRLICRCFCDTGYGYGAEYPTFRQFLCAGVVGAVKPGYPRETLDRATIQMGAAIRRAREHSVDTLLTSRRLGRTSNARHAGTERVFQVIGAIIYDMEWTGGVGELEFKNTGVLADATNTISPTFNLGKLPSAIFELMLLIDYGFPAYPLFNSPPRDSELNSLWSFERFSGFLTAIAWRWKQGHAIPDQQAWDLIIHVLDTSGTWECDYYTWDAATMFYYYYSRRKPVGAKGHWQGWTGYTGVLQEMAAEVSTRGTDRLERKLSFDVHYLIPSIVRDPKRRVQMISIAKDLASRHGCKLEVPDMTPSAAPAPETPRWCEWLASLFRFGSPGERSGDEENRAGKETLLEGLEEEESGTGGANTDKRSEKTSAQRLRCG